MYCSVRRRNYGGFCVMIHDTIMLVISQRWGDVAVTSVLSWFDHLLTEEEIRCVFGDI